MLIEESFEDEGVLWTEGSISWPSVDNRFLSWQEGAGCR